jgi:dTDP-4-dehydrorhamnose reductase
MKYAILGAAGQLGANLTERLPGSARPLTRQEADLTQPETLKLALSAARPDVVFNCAAYNFVDRAENETAAAFAVNAFGVRDLALICRELNCVLVHFSTDYVFGLEDARRDPYSEDDAPGPVSVYGLSKLAGEYLTRAICPKHFIIRTCGLYGRKGRGGKGDNFVEKMVRLAQSTNPLRVVADQMCTPSYTADVAEAAVALVETKQYGLYHLTNADSCSWFDFAKTIFAIRGIQADLTPIRSHDFKALARRPSYSVLAMGAYKRLGLKPPRSWRDALAAYLTHDL